MAETPLAAARKEAEAALAIVAQRYPNGRGSYDTLSICTSALRSLLAAAREAEAALAEEREKLAKAERRGEKAAVALTRAHEVLAQQRSLIDPDQYPEIDAAAGEVLDPCDEFADRMDRAETELRIVNDERDRLREQLAEERRRREEAIIIKADLAAIPVHFVSLLPRGRIFMHPDTPKSGVRDPWPPTMPTQEAPR